MKKFFNILCALAAVAMIAVSCSKEEALVEPKGEMTTVTFSAAVPGSVATKAINDGKNVTVLRYEVYEGAIETGETPIKKGNVTRTSGDQNFALSVELVNDQTYSFIFWAEVDGKGHYTTTDLKNVVANYTNVDANDESRAAFFAVENNLIISGAISKTITLVRPFAQINFGTSKLKSEATDGDVEVTVSESKLVVKKAAASFNTLTGKGEGEVEVTFKSAARPSDTDEKINVNSKDYQWLSMNYIMVQNDNDVVDLDVEFTTSKGVVKHSLVGISVKENYRTNIIGDLLFNKADFNIVVDAEFNEPAENVEIWDGTTVTRPDFDAATNTWSVDNGAEFAWIAAAVNGTLPASDNPATKAGENAAPYNFAGETIKLTKDIYLGEREWTPIGVGTNRFHGTFDGNDFSINDFKISKHHGNYPQAALFGNTAGTVAFKNLTITGAQIIYPGNGDFYGAALIATAYGNVSVENVTVEDCYISGNNKVAGILAHDGVVSSLTIDNCHVNKSKIESLNEEDGGNVGGLVGLLQADKEFNISNSSVKNTVINAINSTNTGKRANSEFIACVTKGVININDCEVSGNTFTQNEGVTYVSPYGVFVGGERNDNGMATVIVDGQTMISEGLVKEGDTFIVSAPSALQVAFAYVGEGETVKLADDFNITEPAYGANALNYDKAVSCTIDLNGKTLSANTGNSVFRFNLTGSGATSDVTVTLKNGTVISGDDTWCALMAAGIDGAKAILNMEGVVVKNSKGYDLGVKAWSNGVVNAKNVTVDATNCAGGFYAVGGEITLDNCTVNQEGLYTYPYTSMAFAVSNGGKLTINSGNYSTEPTSASEGNGQGSTHGSWCGGVMNSGGTLIINGGTFANGNYGEDNLAVAARGCLFVDTGAVLEVNGGKFNALKGIVDYTNNLGDASKNPVVTITGGEFSADPYENSYVNAPEGCTAVENNGVWTIVKNYITVSTLADVQAALVNPQFNTIYVSEPIVVAEGEELTLDLNGKTLTAENEQTQYAFNNLGTLTLKNGTVNARGIYNGYNAEGDPITTAKIIIESGTYNAKGTNGGAAVFNQGICEIKGGTFTSIGGYSLNNQATGTMTVEGEGIVVTGGCYNVGSLTINSGNIATERAGSTHAVYHDGSSLKVYGGNFTGNGNEVIMSNYKSAEIYGGTFTKDPNGKTSYLMGGNQMTIYGGTFNAHTSNPAGHPVRPDVVVKGGTFNYRHTSIAMGYKIVDNGNGTWTVLPE